MFVKLVLITYNLKKKLSKVKELADQMSNCCLQKIIKSHIYFIFSFKYLASPLQLFKTMTRGHKGEP